MQAARSIERSPRLLRQQDARGGAIGLGDDQTLSPTW
jgi:hypothetical protein